MFKTPEEYQQHAEEVQKAVDGRNDLVWMAMQYQCKSCHGIEWVYVGVGVEGPPSLRDRRLWIASPMQGPSCLKCKGDTLHVHWSQDKTFLPQDPPEGSRYFRVPPVWTEDHMRRYSSIVFSGDIVVAPLRH